MDDNKFHVMIYHESIMITEQVWHSCYYMRLTGAAEQVLQTRKMPKQSYRNHNSKFFTVVTILCKTVALKNITTLVVLQGTSSS